MTLSPKQLAGLVVVAEKYAKAWREADGTADDARDDLTDYITSLPSDSFGVEIKTVNSYIVTGDDGSQFTIVDDGNPVTLPGGIRFEFNHDDTEPLTTPVKIEHTVSHYGSYSVPIPAVVSVPAPPQVDLENTYGITQPPGGYRETGRKVVLEDDENETP